MGNKFFNNKLPIAQGILAIVFGLIVIIYPDLSISVLATFFGLVLLLVGAFFILDAYKNRKLKSFGIQNFILGILSIVLAIIILSYPKQSVAAFLFLSVGVWAIVTGAVLIWDYIQNKGGLKRSSVTLVFGIASLLFGVFMVFKPIKGAYGFAVLVGIYAILYGLHALLYLPRKTE